MLTRPAGASGVDTPISARRYDLSQGELAALERELVDSVKSRGFRDCVVGAWIAPAHSFANVVRMHEASYFPEVVDLTDADEGSTLSLVLVDTRAGIERVVHATTVSGPWVARYCAPIAGVDGESGSGFFLIDDLIAMGNFGLEEFRGYYTAAGIDLAKCVSVETNFYIGKRGQRFRGMTSSDLAYMAIFQLFMSLEPEYGRSLILGSINRASRISFAMLGVQYEPLMGRSDLVTSESLRGQQYLPVTIPYNKHNLSIVERIGAVLPTTTFPAAARKIPLSVLDDLRSEGVEPCA